MYSLGIKKIQGFFNCFRCGTKVLINILLFRVIGSILKILCMEIWELNNYNKLVN